MIYGDLQGAFLILTNPNTTWQTTLLNCQNLFMLGLPNPLQSTAVVLVQYTTWQVPIKPGVGVRLVGSGKGPRWQRQIWSQGEENLSTAQVLGNISFQAG